MEQQITEGKKRIGQDIGGAIFIFAGIYFFLKGQMDGLTLGVLLIMGVGISKDIRNVLIFSLKWGVAKALKRPAPSYDLSKAQIIQNSGRDSLVNYDTVHIHNK